MKGLPASGKSTWATEKVKTNSEWKRVSKDDLRSMIDCGKFSAKKELVIVAVERQIVDTMLNNGYSVIVDDTNLNPKYLEYFKIKYAERDDILISVKDFTDVSVEECVKRDSQRSNSVGSKVIHGMWMRYRERPKLMEFDERLPKACLCDIDGTIADSFGRNIYDLSKVQNDLRTDHSHLIESLPFEIIFVSGREEKSRPQTEEWIRKNLPGINWRFLYMRTTGDKRDDSVVKRELWEKFIAGKYNIVGVFDDRPKVIALWKSLHLPVFAVGPMYDF
jgi:predicted kinase